MSPASRPAPDYSDGKWASALAPRAGGEERFWLVKSEPSTFSFDDLLAAPKKTTGWDGVRNSVARNFLRDGMKRGDRVFYYHSSTNPQAIVGIAEVVKEGYPDPTASDVDAAGAPMWWAVDLRAVETLPRPVTLAEIKATSSLASMPLVRIGRLSVSPVTRKEWETILGMSARPAR